MINVFDYKKILFRGIFIKDSRQLQYDPLIDKLIHLHFWSILCWFYFASMALCFDINEFPNN